MRARAVWIALALLLLGLPLAAWHLLADEPAAPDAGVPAAAVGEPVPGRTLVLPPPAGTESERAPLPMASAGAAAPHDREATGPTPSTSDAGPLRRVSGTVVRASDGTPLAGVLFSPRPSVDDGARADLLLAEIDRAGLALAGDGSPDDPDRPPAVGSDPWAFDSTPAAAPGLAPRVTPDGVRSAADGRFELLVPVAEPRLHLAFRARQQTVELPAGEVAGLAVVFDSGFRIHGRVVDPLGAPVAEAAVRVAGVGWAQARADGAGRFELADVAPRAGDVSVDLRAEAPWYERGSASVLVPDEPSIVVPAELVLAGAGALEGLVSDAASQPLTCANVRLRVHSTGGHGNPNDGALWASSDLEGRYRVDAVPAGTWLVEVQAPAGLAPRWFPGVSIVVGETTRLDVTLIAGATLSGRVTDAAGTPVAGAALGLDRIESWPEPGLTGTSITGWNDSQLVSTPGDGGVGRSWLTEREADAATDGRGEYRLEGLSDGDKRLTVRGPVGGGLAPARIELQIAGGRDLLGFDVVLPAGLAISGVVADSKGAPVADARLVARRQVDFVALDEGEASSDAAGRFQIANLAANALELDVWAEGFLQQVLPVRPGGPELQIVLEPAPTLRGLVRDARDGRVVPDFVLKVGRPGGWLTTDKRDDDGAFAIPVWDDEPYEVTVSAGGYAPITVANLRPSETAGAPLVFELQPSR